MRIIGGSLKGRVLSEFSKIGVRPTSDMLRESLFNILGKRVTGCVFLDLFSGTGAVGFEAYSRGAKTVILNDNSKESLALIEKNANALGVKGFVEVSNSDGLKVVDGSRKFDIIFIDPPYKSGLGEVAVERSFQALNDDGIIIYESEEDKNFAFSQLCLYDKRRYGRAFLYFFKVKKPACVFAGTFDPLTKGHQYIIDECINRYEKTLVVLGENPNKKPYFSKEVRKQFLIAVYGNNSNVKIVDYEEHKNNYYEFLLSNSVTDYVRGIRNEEDKEYEDKQLENNQKLYPLIQTVYIKTDKKDKKLSSTLVRENVENNKPYKNLVPKEVFSIIEKELNKKD